MVDVFYNLVKMIKNATFKFQKHLLIEKYTMKCHNLKFYQRTRNNV